VIAIGRASVRATIIAGAVVAVIAVAAGMGMSRFSAARAPGTSVIGVPVSASEPAVLAALKSVGIDRVWSATNTVIPLSDFSRIVEVPFAEADLRAGPEDPRRTPLFDELERRLYAKGPDGSTWRLLYVESAIPDVAALAAALRGAGIDWAASVTANQEARWWWIPVCSWGLWLVMRRPRNDRLHRALLVSAWLPLLARPGPESAILAVVLQTASVQWVRAQAARNLRALWVVIIPEALLAVGMLVLDPFAGLVALASVPLAALVLYTRPRVDRLLRRHWIHPAPHFVPLTAGALHRQFHIIALGLTVPVLAIWLGSVFVPARSTQGAALSGLRIERDHLLEHIDGRDLLEKHIAYQRALTWGRIGEAVWGQKTFTEAYQYVEKSGTMHRASADGQATIGPSGQRAMQPVPLPRQALALLDEDWEFRVVPGQAEVRHRE